MKRRKLLTGAAALPSLISPAVQSEAKYSPDDLQRLKNWTESTAYYLIKYAEECGESDPRRAAIWAIQNIDLEDYYNRRIKVVGRKLTDFVWEHTGEPVKISDFRA